MVRLWGSGRVFDEVERLEMELDAGLWAQETFGDCQLGDKRRTKRLVKMGGALLSRAGASISKACKGDDAAMQGAYRFIRSDKIDPEDVAEGGFKSTVRKVQGRSLVVVAQDTTVVGYSHSAAEDLGDIGAPEESRKRGYLVHSSLAVDADSEETIGLVDLRCWRRSMAKRGKRHKRKERPYRQKESYKWQAAMEATEARLGALMDSVITVCDREGDVYEFLQRCVKHGRRFVVRVCQDRKVNGNKRIWRYMGSRPVIGGLHVEVKQKGGRKKRIARVVIRSARVVVEIPKRVDGSDLERVEVGCVYAVEVGAARGVTPLEWMLWTSEPCEELREALEVVRYYRLRWRVEDFHAAWKDGCKVERQRMRTSLGLVRMALTLAFVAVGVMQLKERRDDGRACTEVLDEQEWKMLWLSTQKEALPAEAPSMRWAHYAMGTLGGWHGNKRTGTVGYKAIWEGWFLLTERLAGWRLLNGENQRA